MPASPEIHNTLGFLLRRQGEPEQAASEMELAAALRRERESVYSAIASTESGIRQRESGDLAGAVEQFRAVVSRAPEFAPAYFHLSLALQKLGRSQEAAQARHTAQTLDAGLRLCRSSLGLRAWLQTRTSGNCTLVTARR